MSILGKLLAVGNVLVAVGFLSLAAMDWAKRHAWTYAVYRHELALTGLPIDDSDRGLVATYHSLAGVREWVSRNDFVV